MAFLSTRETWRWWVALMCAGLVFAQQNGGRAVAPVAVTFAVTTGDGVNTEVNVAPNNAGFAAVAKPLDSTASVIQVDTAAVFRVRFPARLVGPHVTLVTTNVAQTPLIVAACNDNTIRAVQSGPSAAITWTVSAGFLVATPVVISSTAVGVFMTYGGSSQPVIAAYNASRVPPALLWTRSTTSERYAAPVVVLQGDQADRPVVIASSLSASLYGFDAVSGIQLWSAQTNGQMQFAPMPLMLAGSDGALSRPAMVTATSAGNVECRAVSTGALQWRSSTSGEGAAATLVTLSAMTTGASTIVVHCGLGGRVTAISSSDGTVIWRLVASPAGAAVMGAVPVLDNASSALVAAAGREYFASVNLTLAPIVAVATADGFVVAVAALTGRVIAYIATNGSITAPIVVTRDQLLVTTGDVITAVDALEWLVSMRGARGVIEWPPSQNTSPTLDGAVRIIVIVVPVVVLAAVIIIVVVYCCIRARKIRGADARRPAAPPHGIVAVAVEGAPMGRPHHDNMRSEEPQAITSGPATPIPRSEVVEAPAVTEEPPSIARLALGLHTAEPSAATSLPWPWVEWLTRHWAFPTDVDPRVVPSGMGVFDATLVRDGRLFLLTIVVTPATRRPDAAADTAVVWAPLQLESRAYGHSVSPDGAREAWILQGALVVWTPATRERFAREFGHETMALWEATGGELSALQNHGRKPNPLLLLRRLGKEVAATSSPSDANDVPSPSYVVFDHNRSYLWPWSCVAPPLAAVPSQPFVDPSHGRVHCDVCFVPISVHDGQHVDACACSGHESEAPHIACQECVNARLNALFDREQLDPDRVPCPMLQTCRGAWRLEDFIHCLDAPTLRRWHRQTVDATSKQVHGAIAASTREAVSSHLSRELRDLLQLCCPRCGLQFHSFSGCVTVTCGVALARDSTMRGCGATFCGACLQPVPCAAGHGHVQMSELELRRHWNRWRVGRLTQYRRSHRMDRAEWNTAVNAIRADLGAVGIALSALGE